MFGPGRTEFSLWAVLCATGKLSGKGGGCAETLLRAMETFRLSFLAAYVVHSYMSYVLCQVVLCWVIGGNCLVCPCSAAVVTAGDSSTLRSPVGSHRFKSAADWGWGTQTKPPKTRLLHWCHSPYMLPTACTGSGRLPAGPRTAEQRSVSDRAAAALHHVKPGGVT